MDPLLDYLIHTLLILCFKTLHYDSVQQAYMGILIVLNKLKWLQAVMDGLFDYLFPTLPILCSIQDATATNLFDKPT